MFLVLNVNARKCKTQCYNGYSSFSKRESPKRYIQCIFGVLSPKALIIMTDPHSKTANARKRKTQWIDSSFSKRESPRASYLVYLRSSKSKSANYNEWSSFYNHRECRKAQNIYSVLIFLNQGVQKRYLECMFLVLKRECPKAKNAMDVVLSQSVRAQDLTPKALITMNEPRSKIVNARKRKTQWIFFVLKTWEPKNVI